LRILLTGRNGQVGWELERVLPSMGEVIATDRTTLDLADSDMVRRAVRDTRPDVIVNAAAYTAVDKAEAERELAGQINAIAPGVLGEEAKRLGALLVHYSTDYVFDGNKRSPYTEDDTPTTRARNWTARKRSPRADAIIFFCVQAGFTGPAPKISTASSWSERGLTSRCVW
jgi:dTDP-4-dehydrorhamnose reductase